MKNALFREFNFSLLEDPRFKEDSVREELISPLIKELGYKNSGNTQVIRNHVLKHPFISIGSSRKPVTIIPDYLLQVNAKPAWILEAKSPTELITDKRHIEQAYSYAIHPEIRVNYFALCNGHFFSLFNINKPEPLFYISLKAIDLYLSFIKEILSPVNVFIYPDETLSKDFGLHVKRLGFKSSDSIILIGSNPLIIMKYDDNSFSYSSPVGDENSVYLGTFDFDLEVAKQLRPLIGEEMLLKLMEPTNGHQMQFHLSQKIELNIRFSLPENENLIENEKEIYLPLKIKEFLY